MGRARRGRGRRGRGRSGDEARRHEHARARRVRSGRRAALDPPRAELRHRVRALLERDGRRDRPDRSRRRLDGRVLRPLGCQAPGAARRAWPADRRQPLEPRRPHPPPPRHGLHRPALVAGVQPRRQLHRDRRRDPPRRARRRGPRAAPAAAHARRRRPVKVPAEAAGERLDRWLASQLGSRAAAERAVEAGALVDGVERAKSYRLRGGEELEVPEPAAPEIVRPPAPPIVWEDEHVLVVDKPAGLVVHPGAGHASGTLVDALAGKIAGGDPERPGVVHRLDRATSGLIALARSEEAHARLSELVRERAFERGYLALVRGRPRSRSGRIEAPIGRDRDDPTRISLDTDTPRDAITQFEIEELWPEHALLRVRLETGRTHQIRVHLAAVGLPVAGDAVYGVPAPTLDRQFLHAATLAFPHPFSGERVEARSELPADLAQSLAALPLPGS